MKILITGACGFAGRHLIKYLHNGFYKLLCGADDDKAGNSKLPQITSVDISDYKSIENLKAGCMENAESSGILKGIDFIRADISEDGVIQEIVSKIKPDRIYHLAGQPSVGYSWKEPVKTFEINVIAGIKLFEAAKMHCPGCRILVACTAEEYAPVFGDADSAIREDFPVNPSNPYAISKAAIDFFASTYQKAYGMQVFVSRSFNHIGPGQSESFVTADFAKQIAEIEAGRRPAEIFTGNLDTYRDFLDVRDAVRAYCYITEYGRAGEPYNVCSGKKIRISEILEIMLSLSSAGNIKITVDEKKLRPVDIKSIYGSNSKIKEHTGWEPKYNIKDTLKDTLDWWRERSKSK